VTDSAICVYVAPKLEFISFRPPQNFVSRDDRDKLEESLETRVYEDYTQLVT
jgi:hypothetical protein